MSQSVPTPAWGTPVPPNAAAETQVIPPVSQAPQQRPAGPTRGEVELRSTALYYATRVVGEQPTMNTDSKTATVLRTAKKLESYLLTGDTSGI